MRTLGVLAIVSVVACIVGSANAVTVEITGKEIDAFALEVLQSFRGPFEKQVSDLGGTVDLGKLEWVGLEGTKKPSGHVAYLGTCLRNGTLVVTFGIKVRVKVDTGTGLLTTKLGAVETQQFASLRSEPTVENGRPRVVVSLSRQGWTLKEGSGKQAQADELAEKVQVAIAKFAEPHIRKFQERMDEITEGLPQGARLRFERQGPDPSSLVQELLSDMRAGKERPLSPNEITLLEPYIRSGAVTIVNDRRLVRQGHYGKSEEGVPSEYEDFKRTGYDLWPELLKELQPIGSDYRFRITAALSK